MKEAKESVIQRTVPGREQKVQSPEVKLCQSGSRNKKGSEGRVQGKTQKTGFQEKGFDYSNIGLSGRKKSLWQD